MNQGRKLYILKMLTLAAEEPLVEGYCLADQGLVTRTLQYAGSAWPKVTAQEVKEVMGMNVTEIVGIY